MDADTVGDGHEKVLREFEEKKVPILIGTQMVAKGLDFENVTLVGVLAADLSLYVDHYRASERTFSLITQVVGRAGRGSKEGRAVIQTYTPENDVILAAAGQDYDRFYDAEIRMRRLRRDPPFADQFMITVTGPEETRVRRDPEEPVRRGGTSTVQRTGAGDPRSCAVPGCEGQQPLPLPRDGDRKKRENSARAHRRVHEGIHEAARESRHAYIYRL